MEQRSEIWLFSFHLESDTGQPVPRSAAEELLDRIIELAEARGLAIGGGFSAAADEDEDSSLGH